MATKDVLYIHNYTNKDGEEKAIWSNVGTCFGSNKDGSMNFQFNVPVSFKPGDKLQIRERKQKDGEESGGWD